MDRVIVSVKRADLDWSRDLELPADMPMGQLAPMIAGALRWPLAETPDRLNGYAVEARPSGHEFRANESLAHAGVWDGAWLVFHPSQAVLDRARQDTSSFKPEEGWRRLDGAPAPPPPPKPDAAAGEGFAWKRLDEE
jgi:hypothetical protein